MERLIDKLTEYLATARGREVNLRDIRAFLKIEAGSKDDTNLRTQMSTTLTKNKVVKPSGKQDLEMEKQENFLKKILLLEWHIL